VPHIPAQTRSKLLAAAVKEFSRHGFAGARIERISAAAGVNRERLYAYFGSKKGLFETVLNQRLAMALDAAEVRGSGPKAVADFAAAYFDACVATQDLPRLVTWEGMELDLPMGLDARERQARRKADDLAAAVGMTGEQAADVLLTVVTLCHGWVTGPHVARIIAGDETAHRRRREHVVGVARMLAEEHARATAQDSDAARPPTTPVEAWSEVAQSGRGVRRS
jgi:AcrR family transcriptional regulator